MSSLPQPEPPTLPPPQNKYNKFKPPFFKPPVMTKSYTNGITYPVYSICNYNRETIQTTVELSENTEIMKYGFNPVYTGINAINLEDARNKINNPNNSKYVDNINKFITKFNINNYYEVNYGYITIYKIYRKFRKVLRKVTLEMLIKLAVLINKYDFYEIIKIFRKI